MAYNNRIVELSHLKYFLSVTEYIFVMLLLWMGEVDYVCLIGSDVFLCGLYVVFDIPYYHNLYLIACTKQHVSLDIVLIPQYILYTYRIV